MPKKGTSISLSSYDDIFSTEEERSGQMHEQVRMIPLEELHPFEGHHFRVCDDEEMQKTVESVKQYGVLTPVIARPDSGGGYEIISGHRRLRASELAGLDTLPVIVREMDDDTAIILMVDSNLQRENILPSERAFAYKMKLEAIKHQGERTDLNRNSTSTQLAQKLSVEKVGEDSGVSKDTVRKFIRLTELIPELRDMVDEKKLSFNPAEELSYLKPEEQKNFLEAMDYAQTTPSLSQAQRLKKLSREGRCSLEAMCGVMDETKKEERPAVTIPQDVLQKYFPKSYTPRQMQEVIVKLLDQWQKKRTKERSR